MEPSGIIQEGILFDPNRVVVVGNIKQKREDLKISNFRETTVG